MSQIEDAVVCVTQTHQNKPSGVVLTLLFWVFLKSKSMVVWCILCSKILSPKISKSNLMLPMIWTIWAVQKAPMLYVSLFCELCSLQHSFMLREQRQCLELQNKHLNKVHATGGEQLSETPCIHNIAASTEMFPVTLHWLWSEHNFIDCVRGVEW